MDMFILALEVCWVSGGPSYLRCISLDMLMLALQVSWNFCRPSDSFGHVYFGAGGQLDFLQAVKFERYRFVYVYFGARGQLDFLRVVRFVRYNFGHVYFGARGRLSFWWAVIFDMVSIRTWLFWSSRSAGFFAGRQI